MEQERKKRNCNIYILGIVLLLEYQLLVYNIILFQWIHATVIHVWTMVYVQITEKAQLCVHVTVTGRAVNVNVSFLRVLYEVITISNILYVHLHIKKYHTNRTVPKSIRKIVEKGKKWITLTHIYNAVGPLTYLRSLPLLTTLFVNISVQYFAWRRCITYPFLCLPLLKSISIQVSTYPIF
jgi:hypothetical protein